MEPITRRQALALGAWSALGIAVGGVGLSSTGLPWAATGVGRGPALREPAAVRSAGGVLRTELVAASEEVELAGRRARVLAYSGAVPATTWRVRPGDRIEVRLVNRLAVPTNLHTHGLSVSPSGSSDNPFLSIAPGEAFDYAFDLPEDHPPGVFWYHPHRHGSVADQVFAGMFGAIVVEDDDVPEARERVLVISDTTLTPAGAVAPAGAMQRMLGREGELLLVNGQLRPQITARPGERERWRVVNACTSRYLRLALPGQQLHLLGTDSGHEPAPREIEEALLAPGNRIDLLVTMRAGSSELRTLGHDRLSAMAGMMAGAADVSGPGVLADVRVEGASAATGAAPAVPSRPADADLRGREPDARRAISFSMSMGMGMGPAGGMGPGGMGSFGFDGRAFDEARIDQRVAADAVEEWTISNPTPMDHPFHLHVWPMQVVEADGAAVADVRWRDVVHVPAQGRVVVRIAFTRFSGVTVYHCHILDHEDAGMMATVERAGG
ncbi:multicopper oxidase family protein [Agrococcus sediminis]|uniref:Multicopper oxidase family protein n=1 Tax=Agrococcus sediminis TaxID=2599924 RepID=A0A5M8Q7S6_9MICO|nr:multicopper oxidase family protein [Agrococcus sediminis]KAA6431995.1 multicopper oxidase family protein [Agrococcus sediminis]